MDSDTSTSWSLSMATPTVTEPTIGTGKPFSNILSSADSVVGEDTDTSMSTDESILCQDIGGNKEQTVGTLVSKEKAEKITNKVTIKRGQGHKVSMVTVSVSICLCLRWVVSQNIFVNCNAIQPIECLITDHMTSQLIAQLYYVMVYYQYMLACLLVYALTWKIFSAK